MRENFLKFCFGSLFLIVFSFTNYSFAQLTGTKTIPGDYATIEAAIADLNLQGIGAGGVTFNVTAGHTETFTTATAGVITATGTISNPIIFQKSGVGNNPLITASGLGIVASSTALGAHGDGIIIFEGSDFVTFDGIDMQEYTGATGNAKMEYGYYFKKASGGNACKNVTIRNCNITLDKTTIYSFGIYVSNISGTTNVTVTSTGGRSENIKIYSNTISNVYGGVQIRGFAAFSPYDFYDQNIEIGVEGANSITNYGGGSSIAHGIYATNQNNLKIADNTISGSGNSSLYGIYTHNGLLSNVDIYGNTITIVGGGTTGSLYAINNVMGTSGTDNTVNIYDNVIENCTYPTATYGPWYMIYNTANANTVNIYENTIRNNDKGGSGFSYLLYNEGAASNENIFDNIIYNNANNGTGAFYGLYSKSGSSVKKIYSNDIYSLDAQGSVYGIYQEQGSTIDIYNNMVYDLSSSTTSAFNSVYGLYSFSGTNVYLYNNYVYDLKAPGSANVVAGTCGIALLGGTNVNAYYNTVLLNYTSTSSGNTSAAISVEGTLPSTVDMRNNIFVNTVDVTVGTRAVAFRKGGPSIANLSANVNNNLYYSGTPSAKNLIYYDGINSFQTLNEYKAFVTPLDVSSVTENPPFLSVTSPYDLHLKTTDSTQVESGGTPITTPITITTDYDGNTRNAFTPDIGADEFNGIALDLTSPIITYGLLPNTTNTTNISLTATITDASGVAGSPNLPRLYIKKSSDVSYFFDNNPTISGNDFTFNINYSLLGGVAIGDTIQYYVAAQDILGNAGTNPVGGSGVNPPGTTPPTSPNTYLIIDLPLSGTYTIGLSLFKQLTGKEIYFENRSRAVTRDLNGVDAYQDNNNNVDEGENQITSSVIQQNKVIVTENYKLIMEDGKPFDYNFFISDESVGVYPTITSALNDMYLRGISGPVTFLLIDANYPNETYPIDLTSVNGASVTNTVTFKPATGVQAVIPGDALQTTATLRFNSSGYYYIIDGSNSTGGTTRDLKISVPVLGFPAVHFFDDGSNNRIDNTIIESMNTSTNSGSLFIADGSGNNNNIINNCLFKTVEAATQYANGVFFLSTTTSSNNTISNCEFVNFTDRAITLQGGAGVTGNKALHNIIYHTVPSPKAAVYGIYLGRGPDNVVEGNIIYNLYSQSSNPTITGIYYAGASVDMNIRLINNAISLPFIQPSGTIRGIAYFGNSANSIEMYYNTVFIDGIEITGGTTSAVYKYTAANNFKMYNNLFFNARSNGTGTGLHYAAQFTNTTATVWDLNNNDYYVSGSGGKLGRWGTTDVDSLPQWQTLTLQDGNSINDDPVLVSKLDLRPILSSPLINAGVPVVGISTDILGVTRNSTTPTIGAYEEGLDLPAIPTDFIATAVSSSQINISFIPNLNDDDIVLVWNTSGLFSIPSGLPPEIGDPFAGGTLLYVGTTSPVNHTGLNEATNYFYRAFSYDDVDVLYSPAVSTNATTFTEPILLPYTQNFDAGSIPAKWTQTYEGGVISDRWSVSATSLSGGSPNEMKADYGGSTGISRLIVGPINTTGKSSLDLEFKHFYDDWTPGVTGITAKIQSSTDATTWLDEDYSFTSGNGDIGPETVITTITHNNNIGDTTYVAWVLEGNHGYFDAWYIDEVLISSENTFQLTVNIINNWNIVSIPGLHPESDSVQTWWSGKVVGSTVYRFAPGTGYVSVLVATPTLGYWMKNNGAQTYNTGDEWPTGGILYVDHDPITVAQGWNMIGGYECNVPVPGGISPSPLGTVWKFTSIGYEAATELVPGYGYWAKFATAGPVTLTCSTLKDAEVVNIIEDEWGRIIITDNTDRSSTLYAVNDEVNLSNYELPPLPPSGMFDVRYGSNRIAEDIKFGQQTIDMQGVEYPVKVRVEGMSIKLQDISGKIVNTTLNDGQEVVISNGSVNKLIILSEEVTAPIEYSLEQNYPNPFNPSTTIKFSIPEAAHVSLNIFNVLGEKVADLVNGKLEAGRYSYEWNAGSVATGLYIYELRTDNYISTKKMLLLK